MGGPDGCASRRCLCGLALSTDNALPAGLPADGFSDGWSGRITGGVTRIGSGTLALGVEHGGLGADYKLWTASGRLNVPF
jgi:hypothetical protein